MRPICLFGDLEFGSSAAPERALARLLVLPRQPEPGEIEVQLCTTGGDLAVAFALADAIRLAREAGWTVGTFALGECSSAGLYPLVTGTPGKRRVARNTDVFFHAVSQEIHKKTRAEAFASLAASLKQATEQCMAYLAAHSRRSPEEYRPLLSGDLDYLVSPAQLVEWGLVDEVV